MTTLQLTTQTHTAHGTRGREHTHALSLPASGDAVAALLDLIAAPEHSRVVVSVPNIRLLKNKLEIIGCQAHGKLELLHRRPREEDKPISGADFGLQVAAVARGRRCVGTFAHRALMSCAQPRAAR
jgi:hypothetical protein